MHYTLTGWILLLGPSADEADMRYITPFTAPDAFLCLCRGPRKILCVSAMEKARALKISGANTDVFSFDEVCPRRSAQRTTAGTAVALLKKSGVHTVQVSSAFPAAIADALRRSGMAVHVCSKELFPARAVKSDEEIEKIKASQQAAVAAVKWVEHALIKAEVDAGGRLRKGQQTLTSESVAAGVESFLYDMGYLSEGTIIACGAQSADPHEPGHGPLFAGRPIIVDIFPRNRRTGYWGDITRTFVKGAAPAHIRRMYQAVLAAQKEALRNIRPRVRVKTVHRCVQQLFDQAGFPTVLTPNRAEGFIHSTGHGIGLDIHEAPRLSCNDATLKKGVVVTVEPGLYYPETGGVRIEDMVYLTGAGWKYCATMHKRMVVP